MLPGISVLIVQLKSSIQTIYTAPEKTRFTLWLGRKMQHLVILLSAVTWALDYISGRSPESLVGVETTNRNKIGGYFQRIVGANCRTN